MAFITDILNTIKNARKGKDMRQAIYDGIQQCYKDATGHPDSVAAVVERLKIEKGRIDELATSQTFTGNYTQSNLVFHAYRNATTGDPDPDDSYNYEGTSGKHEMPICKIFQEGTLDFAEKQSNEKVKILKEGLYIFELRIFISGSGKLDIEARINDVSQRYNAWQIVAQSTEETKIIAYILYLKGDDVVSFYGTPGLQASVRAPVSDVNCYVLDWIGKAQISDCSKEISDIRVGEDGAVYGTAGEAVRKQIGNLTEDLGDLVTTYHNDKTGKVLGYANGDIGSTVSISSQSWCAHIKVSVIGGTKLYVKTKFDSNYTYVPVVLFCNSGNLVISKLTKSYSVHDYHTEILDVPSDARYAYINISDSAEDVYNNCIAGINYTKISAKEEIDSLKSFDAEAVNRLSFCRVDDSIITSGAGYPIFTEGILNGWGTQSYITHRMFAVNSNKYYAFDANNSVDVYFLDLNKSLIEKKEYTTTSYWYHKIIDVLPLNCSFLIITSNPSNNFVQEPPVCYELFSSNDGIPKYYHLNSYIENKVQAIRNNASIVKGCTFAFITDIHFFFNTLMSGALLKYIKANTPLNLIVCGGDIPPAEGTLEKLNKSAELYNRLTDKLGRNSWLTVKGNHDYCIDGDTPKTMTEGYQYNQIVRPLEISKAILSNGKAYYYYDLPSQKIRFIVLDQYETTNSGDVRYGVMSNVTDEQLSWLANALSVEGYTFLVFSHSSCDSNISGYDSVLAEVNRMLCAVNNKRVYTHSSVHVDFTKTTSIVACSIAGHNHIDLSNMTDGLLSITTTSDAALADGGIARTAGTISEQAFDVFTVDTENKKIKAIRIGGGEDRSWTY